MIVINSGAYVNSEFTTEFGKIPPCLLPIGNHKLIEYQIQTLNRYDNEKVIVSIPESYQFTFDERKLFNVLNITIVKVPDHYTLAESLLFILNTENDNSDSLRVLHGDTLLKDIPIDIDVIAVSETEYDYNWEKEGGVAEKNLVWTGFFSFSSSTTFIKSLALSKSNFVEAVRIYQKMHSLKLCKVKDWFDLGHINTYYLSRSKITTQRVFNFLKINNNIVWKSGENVKKIQAEYEWFKKIPASLKNYIPQLIDGGIDKVTKNFFYTTEYLPCIPLNEVYVHGRNPVFYWDKIFKLLSDFLIKARDVVHNASEESVKLAGLNEASFKLYSEKTYNRLNKYAEQADVDLHRPRQYDGVLLPSLINISEECINAAKKLPVIPAFLHGDLCLSNILFDSRRTSIKLIDPRGMDAYAEIIQFGDQKYDVAKLTHSVIGLYDFIIAGRYELHHSKELGTKLIFDLDERLTEIQENFVDHTYIDGITVRQIMPITILLFLSMLPLHNDSKERQEALMVNALRLYKEYFVSNAI